MDLLVVFHGLPAGGCLIVDPSRFSCTCKKGARCQFNTRFMYPDTAQERRAVSKA